MKNPFALSGADKKTSFLAGGLAVYLFVVGGLVAFLWPDLTEKIQKQKEDRNVAIAADWEDVRMAADREKESVGVLLKELTEIPAGVMAVPSSLPFKEENRLRRSGFRLMWRHRQVDGDAPAFLNRLREGDGLLSYGDVAVGYPRRLREVAAAISGAKGFLPMVEFAPQTGLSHLAGRVKNRLMKGHCLQAKEQLLDKRRLWGARMVRAVEKRWVRLLYFQMSPVLRFQENVSLQEGVVRQLRRRGYAVGFPSPFPFWGERKQGGIRSWTQGRIRLAFLLSVLSPIFGVFFVFFLRLKSPVVSYVLAGALSLGAGIAVHALGSFPEAVLGLCPLRGVKLQFLLPFVFMGLLLLTKEEWKTILTAPLRGRHIILFGALAVLFFGGLLMRSGNFPLLPVLDSERAFRDVLESFFGARPRFKEFLIGHPLFILGLYLRSKEPGTKHALADGRFFMWLGLLGQISIVNTFLHFHAPLEQGIIRTAHGLWLGFLASVPLCYAYPILAGRLRRHREATLHG